MFPLSQAGPDRQANELMINLIRKFRPDQVRQVLKGRPVLKVVVHEGPDRLNEGLPPDRRRRPLPEEEPTDANARSAEGSKFIVNQIPVTI